MFADMPNSNAVWASYLRSKGFKRYTIPDNCPECFTIEDFCREYPTGTYIVATGSHAVCIKDGTVLDNWNSLNEIPTYFFTQE